MRRFISLFLLIILSFTFVNALSAPAKKRTIYKAQFYYVDEQMFLCRVTNRKTGRDFYGHSKKHKYAVMYARAACQMQSYKGQCFVKAHCNWEFVKVRKRRYVKTQV